MLLAAGVAEVIERAFNLREEICHSGADCCPWLSPASPRPTRVNYLVCNREMHSPTPGRQWDPKHPAIAWVAISVAVATLQLPRA